MKNALLIVVIATVLLAGCAAQTADEEPEQSVRDAVMEALASASPTPAATPSVEPAPVAAAPPAAPVTAPAPAYVDYITPVQNRWGGCFSRLGVGDLYFDSATSTVTGAWNGGALSWAVGPGNTTGTPADQQSKGALAGC